MKRKVTVASRKESAISGIGDQTFRIKYKFVQRLVDMMNDTKMSCFVSWSKAGDVIEINNLKGFKEKVLTKYYKHCNLSNFIRQLNMYNFKKIKSGQDKDDNKLFYQNPNFLRGRLDLITKINRCKIDMRKLGKAEQLPKGECHSSEAKVLSEKEQKTLSLSNLSIRNLKLKAKSLKSSLKQAFLKNKELISFGNKSSKVKEDAEIHIFKLEKSMLLLYNYLADYGISIEPNSDFNTVISKVDENSSSVSANADSSLASYCGKKYRFLSSKRIKPEDFIYKVNDGLDSKSKTISMFMENLKEKTGHRFYNNLVEFKSMIPELQTQYLKSNVKGLLHGEILQESFRALKDESFSKWADTYLNNSLMI